MRLLHTSDWHLGHTLYGHKRDEEFDSFLQWLLKTLQQERVDVLTVAGDIFDTVTPNNKMQELYYNFLGDVRSTGCRHVVVVGGNHDSPSFLDAPRQILSNFNIHVIGAVPGQESKEKESKEVLLLKDVDGKPEAVVCAVPYLRDSDIRSVTPGESSADKDQKLSDGIRKHYADVYAQGEQIRSGADIPLIATGHLYASGGRHESGDGVRDLSYRGSLLYVDEKSFPSGFDYVALGHLHIPQQVGNSSHIRYAGSPIPMGFNESKQEKEVVLVEFEGRKRTLIQELSVPCFQPLEQVCGKTLQEITERLTELSQKETELSQKKDSNSIWIEIKYTGDESVKNLWAYIEPFIKESNLEVLCVKSTQVQSRNLYQQNPDEVLNDLDKEQVFDRCLKTKEVSSEDSAILKEAYSEILKSLNEKDPWAE